MVTAGARARKAIAAARAAGAVTVAEVLDGHVVLELECLDRVYLNGRGKCVLGDLVPSSAGK